MKIVESDTARLLHEAHRSGNQAEIDRLQARYEEEVRERIAQVRTEFDGVKTEQLSAEASGKQRTGETKRYKEFIKLYREAVALAKEISDYKKTMRVKE